MVWSWTARFPSSAVRATDPTRRRPDLRKSVQRPAHRSASGLVCSQKRDTLLRAYNLTRAVGREGVVTQRLCEVSGIRRRQVAFCKAGICQSFVLLGRKRIFVVPCQRYELPETIIGGQDSRACVEVVGDEP